MNSKEKNIHFEKVMNLIEDYKTAAQLDNSGIIEILNDLISFYDNAPKNRNIDYKNVIIVHGADEMQYRAKI